MHSADPTLLSNLDRLLFNNEIARLAKKQMPLVTPRLLAVEKANMIRTPTNIPRTMIAISVVLTCAVLPMRPESASGQEFARSTDRSISNIETEAGLDVEKLSINQLLKMLDSPKYLEREKATTQLANLGSKSLKPMAIHYLKSSPESCWRIKRTLEQIATNGDEATFLKAVALLQLLVGVNNDQLEAQLMRLKFEWSTKQTSTAIETLESAGAKIENFAPINNTRAIQEWIAKENSRSLQKSTQKRPRSNMSNNERLKLIDEILSGSLKENRKLVLGNEIRAQPIRREAQDVFEVLELQMGNQMIRNGAIRAINAKTGVIARFGESWKGNREQFAELENVDSLAHIGFEKQYIDKSKLETLKNLTSLTTLEFDKCRFSGPALATIGLPKTIEDLRMRNQDIELSTIDRIGKLHIKSLVFDSCKFSDAALKKMLAFSTLGSLELAQMELDAAAFQRMEKMKTLRSLKLSGCKYPFPAYKKLTEKRPEIYIDFTTKAFLGVRSVPGDSTCQISDVVSGSAAEKGGIQPDDVIIEVNGHKIDQFNDLRAHIALYEGGDQLNLTIVRNGKKVAIDVILGDYADAPPR